LRKIGLLREQRLHHHRPFGDPPGGVGTDKLWELINESQDAARLRADDGHAGFGIRREDRGIAFGRALRLIKHPLADRRSPATDGRRDDHVVAQ
jgi:hypothetical protein